MRPSARLDILKKLALEYQELNGTSYEVLDRVPNPTEFARLGKVSRPVLILDKPDPNLDLSAFDDDILCKDMGDLEISIAITPNGKADAIATHSDGRDYFVEPCIERMSMPSFLARLSNIGSSDDVFDVLYLQSQNGNLFDARDFIPGNESISEFVPLRRKVPRNLTWASEAFGCTPDAVNIWIGDERSVTSIHSDPYENIYTVVRGQKDFTLYPPTEGWCLKERLYPRAAYSRNSSISPLILTPDHSPQSEIRWSSIADPTRPIPHTRPLNVSLHAGQTLYLPAGWWHYVRQSNDIHGKCVALNWWFDMEMRGMNWVWLNFLRGDVQGNEEASLSCCTSDA